MNDYKRGMQTGIAICLRLDRELQKSPAFFATYEEWKGYKKGVLDYKEKVLELLEVKI